jgi:hypothetical protein
MMNKKNSGNKENKLIVVALAAAALLTLATISSSFATTPSASAEPTMNGFPANPSATPSSTKTTMGATLVQRLDAVRQAIIDGNDKEALQQLNLLMQQLPGASDNPTSTSTLDDTKQDGTASKQDKESSEEEHSGLDYQTKDGTATEQDKEKGEVEEEE